MSNTYKAKVVYTSKELEPITLVKLTDMTDCNSLDDLVKDCNSEALRVEVDYYAHISVHNEKSKGATDYTKIIIVDTDGVKYSTGSESFSNAIDTITENLADIDYGDKPFTIKVYKKPSKNYNGDFISCSLL